MDASQDIRESRARSHENPAAANDSLIPLTIVDDGLLLITMSNPLDLLAQDEIRKSSSYKTKEKSLSVNRNRKKEKREIDAFMKKERFLKVFLPKARI